MIITKIKRIRGRRQRYSVHLDGVPVLELSDWTIGKCGLRTGDDLDEPTVDKIKSTEAETQAKNIAINYLSYRQRSSKEIIDHLTKKGFTHKCAEDVTRQLQSARMVNDLEFARAFVRDRIKRKPTGQALLRTQLLAKGITSSMTDMVLAELISPQSQQASALQAAKHKIQVTQYSKRNIDTEKRKKRLLDFLLRRGFSYEIALKTIRATLDR
ncbi:MAG: RecX family transcriptional regulator [Bacteroidota bacterium]